MKLYLSITGIAACALLLSGCVVSVGGGGRSRETHTERVVVISGSSEDQALAAEIDAVDSLGLEASRLEALRTIAQRPGLPPASQVHLVDKALSKLGIESSRLLVLNTLIQNSSFSNAGKEAILRQLNRFALEASRSSILKSINERGALNQ